MKHAPPISFRLRLLQIVIAAAFLLGNRCAHSQGIQECAAGSMRAKVIGLEGGAGHTGYAFQITNVSDKPCLLSASPKIQFLDTKHKPLHYEICMNCGDYLFKPVLSPQSRVIEPRASSFFLVGGEAAAWGSCEKAAFVGLALSNNTVLRFRGPHRVGFPLCESVNVSAWYRGEFSDSLCFTCLSSESMESTSN